MCNLFLLFPESQLAQWHLLQLQEAMQQIFTQHYDTKLTEYSSVKQIIKIGIAFCNKAVLSAHQKTDLTQAPSEAMHEIHWSEVIIPREK